MTNRLSTVSFSGILPLVLLGFVCLAGCNSASLRSLSIWKSTDVATIEETISDSDYAPLTIWHESYETAQGIAAEKDMPIMVGFTGSDWCRPCKRLKKNVLDSDEFMAWAGDNAVLLELDYPQDTEQSADIKAQNEVMKTRYQISQYPTMLLTNPDGEVLGKIDLKDVTPTSFIERAESILAN
jgi:protein disulfide-isomerase